MGSFWAHHGPGDLGIHLLWRSTEGHATSKFSCWTRLYKWAPTCFLFSLSVSLPDEPCVTSREPIKCCSVNSIFLCFLSTWWFVHSPSYPSSSSHRCHLHYHMNLVDLCPVIIKMFVYPTIGCITSIDLLFLKNEYYLLLLLFLILLLLLLFILIFAAVTVRWTWTGVLVNTWNIAAPVS